MNKPAQVNTTHKKFLFVLLPFIIFAVIVASYNFHKPFNLDEGEFALAAHNLMGDAKLFSKNPAAGLWHTPLYLYSLSTVFNILGESAAVARGLGFLFYLLTVVFTVLTCKELFKQEKNYIISVIAGCLCLINPLWIQFALLIDIDGGLLTLLMTVFCYFFARFSNRGMNMKQTVILGCIFGLSMLAKFTTPPLIIPSVFLFYIFGRNYKKAFAQSFVVLLTGIIFFWSLWHAYCLIFDVDVLFPFKYTFGSKMGQGGFAINPQKIMLMKGSLLYQLYWVSPAFVMLMILSVVDRVITFIKRKTVDDVDFLMILGVGIFLFYMYYFPRQSMMKYQIPCYPFFIIVISRFLYNVLIKDRKMNRTEIIAISVAAAAVFVYYFSLFPDMVLWLGHGMNAVSDFFKNNYKYFLHLYYLPFVFLPFLFLFVFEKKSFYFCLLTTLMVLTVSIQVVQNIKQTEDYTTANSWHNYGEKGQAQAIEYLNKQLSPDSVFIARKDLGYYLINNPEGVPTRRYIYNSFLRSPRQQVLAKMQELTEKSNIEYIQLDVYSAIQQSFETLSPYYYLDKQFDNFFILKKK